MRQERTYVLWLAGALIAGLALVGLVAAADVNKVHVPGESTNESALSGDDLSKIPAKYRVSGARILKLGETCSGNTFTTPEGTALCLPGNVPFGWVEPEPIQKASFSLSVTPLGPCPPRSALEA
jgi:hypothetical protein